MSRGGGLKMIWSLIVILERPLSSNKPLPQHIWFWHGVSGYDTVSALFDEVKAKTLQILNENNKNLYILDKYGYSLPNQSCSTPTFATYLCTNVPMEGATSSMLGKSLDKCYKEQPAVLNVQSVLCTLLLQDKLQRHLQSNLRIQIFLLPSLA